MHRRRGFMMLDAFIGLAVVGIVTVALVSTLARVRSSARVLADHRAAVRLAEQVLTKMEAGQPAAAGPEIPGVVVRRLGDRAPATGWVWVQVQARQGTQTVSLTGLVPGGAP